MEAIVKSIIHSVTAIGLGLLSYLHVPTHFTLEVPSLKIAEERVEERKEHIVNLLTATTTKATSTKPTIKIPTKPITPSPKPKPNLGLNIPTITLPPITIPSLSTSKSTEPAPTIDTRTHEARVRDALVNIVCFNAQNGMIRVSTGSGVIISPKGVILTNAHVADLFLFERGNERGLPEYECTIRKGNIATAAYKAKLLYIPEEWLRKNPRTYKASSTSANGERDYALLLITNTSNPALGLPSSFNYITPKTNAEIKANDEIIIAGYPASTLGIFSLESALSLLSEQKKIEKVYSFNRTSKTDIFTTESTTLAHQGASGGAIADSTGRHIGVIVSTALARDGKENINAISLPYINSNMKEDIGISLEEFLQTNLKEKANAFSAIAPALRKFLEN